MCVCRFLASACLARQCITASFCLHRYARLHGSVPAQCRLWEDSRSCVGSFAAECTCGSSLEGVTVAAGRGHRWTLHVSAVSLEHSGSVSALRRLYQAAPGVVSSRRGSAQQWRSTAVRRFVGSSLVFHPVFFPALFLFFVFPTPSECDPSRLTLCSSVSMLSTSVHHRKLLLAQVRSSSWLCASTICSVMHTTTSWCVGRCGRCSVT